MARNKRRRQIFKSFKLKAKSEPKEVQLVVEENTEPPEQEKEIEIKEKDSHAKVDEDEIKEEVERHNKMFTDFENKMDDMVTHMNERVDTMINKVIKSLDMLDDIEGRLVHIEKKMNRYEKGVERHESKMLQLRAQVNILFRILEGSVKREQECIDEDSAEGLSLEMDDIPMGETY